MPYESWAQRLAPPAPIMPLLTDLCAHATGVVAEENQAFFQRLGRELGLTLHRYPSGDTHLGWVVPELWRVERALLHKDGRLVFDGRANTLGVATLSRSFRGELDWEELKPHLVTNPRQPEAYAYHCMWQYRPWAADWALSLPHRLYESLGPGRYQVDLATTREPGEMLVATHEHRGRLPQTIVFGAHTCHPHMANDDFAGVALLVRLFQWLAGRETNYSYRLVLGPEHLGPVFYLRDLAGQGRPEIERLVGGAFAEMPGTPGPVKMASTFLGGQPLDLAFANAAKFLAAEAVHVPWRQGAGNDETVWEAPGYEVPFVEVSRCRDMFDPYPEYHTSLDTAAIMDPDLLDEFFAVLAGVVDVLENNVIARRRFDGLVCLSSPRYDLYMERPDPAVPKDLAPDSEAWGYLLDCLPRYLDGGTTALEMAQRHGLPFDAVRLYLEKFADRGLVDLRFAPVSRPELSRGAEQGETTP
jgi:aminopeptidase-like protein